jgi:hypothetical protein
MELAITGFQTVAVASANQALTYVSGSTATASANQAIYASLAFTTSTGANFNVYAPPAPKQYIIWNNSSYTLTIYNSTVIGNTTAAGAGAAVPAGKKVQVFSTGTNFYTIEAANLTGTLAIANGGTGQTTQQAAINALAGATTSAQFLRGNGTNVVMSAIQVADVPTLNQNTTGQAGSVANSVTFNTSGGAAAGSAFNGSAARTVDYSTVGAPSTTGTNASGTWNISISGNAATATSATSATSASSASTATTATTATALTTATGSAPSYSARAWVNFDGVTGSYRTVGNVSSVTRNSTGYYSIAFTTALPDGNYTFAGGAGNNASQNLSVCIPYNVSAPTASGCDVQTNQQNGGLIDGSLVTITFFR